MAVPAVRYTRRLREGDEGVDVEGVGRALARAGYLSGLAAFMAKAPGFRRSYNASKAKAVRLLQHDNDLPATGVYNLVTHKALRRTRAKANAKEWAFDLKAKALMDAYVKEPAPPKLVEPNQGWDSLHKSLWRAYAVARAEPWATDLGTYNPASRLPSGAPSDHAVLPAMAFDIGGFTGGSSNAKAVALFHKLRVLPDVEYVLLGRLYGTNTGVRPFYGGGHDTHIHVSGRR